MRDHRIFAAMYDRMLASTEKAGFADMRAKLVEGASGRTLELGAGTGANLAHYSGEVTELVVTEPDRFMAGRLRERVSAANLAFAVTVIETPSEDLPFESGSFDSVVSTLCFCTVSDPSRVVDEVVRILRPGGRLHVLEHVRDPGEGGLARWQDRLERPWGWIAAGCHPNRATGALLEAREELAVDSLERLELPKAPPLVRPLLSGAFVKIG